MAVEDAPERRHKHGMASGKTLNAPNLGVLGAAQLAELLIEISKGNAAAQRRLRLALAGSAGAAEAARAALLHGCAGGAAGWVNVGRCPFL